LGAFPLVVYWDADARKDLLVGQADGRIKLFLNVNTDADPTFDGGTFLQVGPAGSKTDIDVGYRVTLAVVDWNNDGMKDVVAGATDSKIRVYLNEGTDTEPDFGSEELAQAYGTNLIVPGTRSSPKVVDLDGDGKKDLLTGNYYGELLFYSNTGTDAAPSFSDYSYVESDGVAIDLPDAPRSRPWVCDWTDDGVPDVLIGIGDGKVYLYQGVRMPGDLDGDGNVDLDDYVLFADCLAGPDEMTPPGGCDEEQFANADIEGEDGDVDLADFVVFQEVFAGPPS